LNIHPPAAELLKICGIASGFAFGYDPTGRSVLSIKTDRIPYKIPNKNMKINAEYRLFIIKVLKNFDFLVLLS